MFVATGAAARNVEKKEVRGLVVGAGDSEFVSPDVEVLSDDLRGGRGGATGGAPPVDDVEASEAACAANTCDLAFDIRAPRKEPNPTARLAAFPPASAAPARTVQVKDSSAGL